MKVEQQNKQVFKPITLTIETRGELQLILSFIGSLSESLASEIADELVEPQDTYNALSIIAKSYDINSVKFLGIKINQSEFPIQ